MERCFLKCIIIIGVCVRVCACVCVTCRCVHETAHMWRSEDTIQESVLSSYREFRETKLRCQVRSAVLLPTEPSSSPRGLFLMHVLASLGLTLASKKEKPVLALEPHSPGQRSRERKWVSLHHQVSLRGIHAS